MSRFVAPSLFAVAVVTRFTLLAHPRQVVLDEVTSGKFVNGYLTGQYFFDLHPPLGKLLQAASAHMGGYDGSQDWSRVGIDIAPTVSIFALRWLPAMLGALLVPLVHATAVRLGISRAGALLAATGVLLDTCFARLEASDPLLLIGIALTLFGCAGSQAHLPFSRAWFKCLLAAGVGISAAVCTKWSGVGAMTVAGVHSIFALWRSWRVNYTTAREPAKSWREAARRVGSPVFSVCKEGSARGLLLFALPAMCYILCFWAHITLLPHSGPGTRFMSPNFRATLVGDNVTTTTLNSMLESGEISSVQLPTFWEKFVEINQVMSRTAAVPRRHEIESGSWFELPLMQRPSLVWSGAPPVFASSALPVSRMYGFGSPLVWWLAAAGAAFVLLRTVHRTVGVRLERWLDGTAPRRVLPEASGASEETCAVLLVGHLCCWLPLCGQGRVPGVHQFLPALVYSLLLTGIAFDAIVSNDAIMEPSSAVKPALKEDPLLHLAVKAGSYRWVVVSGVVLVLACSFSFFAPLAFGVPLSSHDHDARMWLNTWH